MGHKTAVILSTYNWPEALELTLTGLARQEDRDFELIVADDGSGPETRALVERFGKDAPFPVRHAWHEDRGYRLAAVRNLGVRATDAEHLIFLDQDAIPGKDWTREHRKGFGPNLFLPGGYVRLTREESELLTVQKIEEGHHESLMNPERRWFLKKKHIYNLFYNVTPFQKKFPRIIGMNFAVHRDLFTKVNGHDEEYEGWGREDSDLRTRMRQAGGGARCLWSRAVVFHKWHPVHPTKPEMRNKQRYIDVKRRALHWRCEKGLVQPGPPAGPP